MDDGGFYTASVFHLVYVFDTPTNYRHMCAASLAMCNCKYQRSHRKSNKTHANVSTKPTMVVLAAVGAVNGKVAN